MLRIQNMTYRACLAGLVIAATIFACGDGVHVLAQNAQDDTVVTVRGHVVNAVTNEPVSRALVNLPGLNAAIFTDDRGHFELSIQQKHDPAIGTITMRLAGQFVEARKSGFLQDDRVPTAIPNSSTKDSPEVVIRLLPEAKIVGHIDIPGSEGDVRIQCQLFRKQMNGGRETWFPERSFTNWVDGEFRFYGLKPGTYKLITHEQLDQESQTVPGARLYGYPPMYYPNTTDFSLSTPIVVKAGETARVNLTVARKEYYRVRIPVENAPADPGLQLSVYPMGHPSPGWSLGFNPREGTIVGILPEGSYTVEANTVGDGAMTGLSNFSVQGTRLDGPALTLVPDATVSVKVREEFQSMPSNFSSPQSEPDNPQASSRRYSNVQVNLTALDDLNMFGRAASSRLQELSQGQDLIIPDVRPGRYRVEVTAAGYVASMQSGGKDLSRQPLVVGLGGAVAPIEIVLRDDGAQVSGTMDGDIALRSSGGAAVGSPPRFVYLLPVGEGGRPRNIQAWQGNFMIDQVPPGNYLVVAFDRERDDLPSGPGEAMQQLVGKGQMIHVESADKVTVHLKVIGSEIE